MLAAAEPLSLQAHPSAEQAARGFALEEAAGLPLTSPQRNYRDSSHKPELICALTEFDALCGFREPSDDGAAAGRARGPATRSLPRACCPASPTPHGTRALFSSIITIPPFTLGPLLAAVLAACVEQGAGRR